MTSSAAPSAVLHAQPAPSALRPPHHVIPLPAFIEKAPDESFSISPGMPIILQPGNVEVERIAQYLADLIGTSADTLRPRVVTGASAAETGIALVIDAERPLLGAEGYELTVRPDGVVIAAYRPAGLFYGVQTLRQLMPAAVEYEAALPRPIEVPAVRVVDEPRFEWRGAMLDVARHFMRPDDVKRYIDLMALYKLNRLHIHLSDDQGWRIEIKSWPNLAEHGGSTQVGGGPGGYYTQEEYADLVEYARQWFITIVPEIDMPGHTNAALASYPELNCDGVAPPLYTGITVGFSTLCVDREITYQFVDDVVREISALTPGDYFHIGGDEVEKLTDEEYRMFIERAQEIVHSHGRRMIGWGEVAAADLASTSAIQYWRPDDEQRAEVSEAVARGVSVVLSPANRVYLDMKYDTRTVLGLAWAGYVNVRDAYDWDPLEVLDGVGEESILGVEAPLWSETLVEIRDIEYMAFPRLIGVAEIGWSTAADRDWEAFRTRLGKQADRLVALGVNFYRAPEIPWQE